MKDLLKYTYMLEVEGIEASIEALWNRYQEILNDKQATWEELNEARAILYFIGYLYPEQIALESLERRIKYIKPEINLTSFLTAIDCKDKEILSKYSRNKNFQKLKKFYEIVKGVKNRIKNNYYLDEERFNEMYDKKKPKDYF
jgi:hypothetical protein